jgi:hypothetical protein
MMRWIEPLPCPEGFPEWWLLNQQRTDALVVSYQSPSPGGCVGPLGVQLVAEFALMNAICAHQDHTAWPTELQHALVSLTRS